MRAPTIAAIILVATATALADPGPGLPFLRRPTATAQQPTKPKPQPAPPQAEQPAPEATPPAQPNTSTEQTAGPQVDVAEVLRRGQMVTRPGAGPRGPMEQAIADATSPPPDDSHKWFFTVLTDGGRESQALLYDLEHSPRLRAWANPTKEPAEARQAWAHVQVIAKDDATQAHRWKNLQVTRYPSLILQPPAHLIDEADPKSWEWGDPSTVVWQWDGYDATAPARAESRADDIQAKLTAYVRTVAAKRERNAKRLASTAAPPPSPGARQAGNPPPSENTAAPTLPLSVSGPAVNPFVGDPTRPAAQTLAPSGGLSLLFTALGLLGSGTGITNTLLLFNLATMGALTAIQWAHTRKKARGQKTILPDDVYSRIVDILTSVSTATGPRPPANQ